MDRRFNYKKRTKKFFLLPAYELIFEGKNQCCKFKNRIYKHSIKIKINPFLRLLGIYLSEGCLVYQKKHVAGINITQMKPDSRKIMKQWMLDCGYKVTDKKEKNLIIWNNQLGNYFKQFGHAKDKFIPRDLLNSLSKEQCNILLEALILGDGYKRKNKNNSFGLHYFTISEQLANDVQELSLKSGYCSTITKQTKFHSSHFGKNPLFKLSIGSFRKTPVIKTSKNVEEDYKGKVYCLTVPNHLMYVRRNGKCVWCGNSWIVFKNDFNVNMKIKYIRLWCSQPHYWVTSKSVSNSKKVFILPLLLLFPKLLLLIGIISLIGYIIYFSKILSEFLKEYDQFSPIKDKEKLLQLSKKWKPFWDIKNGVVLCVGCHKKLHRGELVCF